MKFILQENVLGSAVKYKIQRQKINAFNKVHTLCRIKVDFEL